MSGVDLPVRAVAEPGRPNHAAIGFPPRDLPPSVSSALPTLRPDGFVAATSTGNLYVSGGNGRGVVYGVIHLLEKYFGCRRFSPTVEVFPPADDLALGCLFEAENPVNDVRVVNGEFALDADWRDWLRLHDLRDLYGEGYYVHTFQRLVPWQTWFAAHPEYFALMNGKRVIDQPCLSRPEVFDIAVAKLREEMAAQPEKEIWSVSQNDNFSYCQCPECLKVIEEEGSPAGPDPPLRQPRRRPLPRQDHLHAGLPIFPPGAPADTARAQRRGHALHHRARPQPAHRRGPGGRLLRPRHRGLEPRLRPPLSLGLHGQFLAPRFPLPQPARARAQHPVLRRPRRPQAFPADQHGAGPRMERAQVLPPGPAALGPEGGHRRRDRGFPRRVLRQSRPSHPRLHRRPPRRARALRRPARHLRTAGGPRRGLSFGRRRLAFTTSCSTRPRPPRPAIPRPSPGSGRPACP